MPSLAALSGRVIAVTGASRGIGLAIVQRLAEAGATVLAGAREPAATVIGGCLPMVLDVTDEASVHAFVERAAALGVDTLVNNAGVGRFAPLEQATVDDYRFIMDTNVLGTFLVSRGLVPQFQRRHGKGLASRLVNVTSDVSARTFSGGGLYTASKFAQRALTQTLAREGAAYGLRVTEVRPGMTDTHFNGNTPGRPERASHLRAEDVAEAVLYALSAPEHVRVDEVVVHPASQAVDF